MTNFVNQLKNYIAVVNNNHWKLVNRINYLLLISVLIKQFVEKMNRKTIIKKDGEKIDNRELKSINHTDYKY